MPVPLPPPREEEATGFVSATLTQGAGLQRQPRTSVFACALKPLSLSLDLGCTVN